MTKQHSLWYRLRLLGVTLSVVVLAIWWRSSRAPAPLSALDAMAQHNRDRLAQLTAKLRSVHPVARVGDGTNAEYAGELITDIENELKVLASARTMFNRDELIRAEMERLARDPRHVALAVDLASDWHTASALFGDDQAQARVYAVHMLRYLAGTGDTQHVATAVDRIGETLNREQEWTKGVQYDYVDTLGIYLRAVGPDGFLSDPAAFYDKMHLSERTSLEVEKAFADSGILKNASSATLAEIRNGFLHYLGKEPPQGS